MTATDYSQHTTSRGRETEPQIKLPPQTLAIGPATWLKWDYAYCWKRNMYMGETFQN